MHSYAAWKGFYKRSCQVRLIAEMELSYCVNNTVNILFSNNHKLSPLS